MLNIKVQARLLGLAWPEINPESKQSQISVLRINKSVEKSRTEKHGARMKFLTEKAHFHKVAPLEALKRLEAKGDKPLRHFLQPENALLIIWETLSSPGTF